MLLLWYFRLGFSKLVPGTCFGCLLHVVRFHVLCHYPGFCITVVSTWLPSVLSLKTATTESEERMRVSSEADLHHRRKDCFDHPVWEPTPTPPPAFSKRSKAHYRGNFSVDCSPLDLSSKRQICSRLGGQANDGAFEVELGA